MSEPLAHSARNGVPEQTYREHVGGVIQLAMRFAREITAFSPKWRTHFLSAAEMAATFHDLGKLDEIFQEDLRKNSRKTRLNHTDAGTAYLLKNRQPEAAVAVYAHHRGLPSFPEEREKNKNGIVAMFRDIEREAGCMGLKTYQRSDSELSNYISQHQKLFKPSSFTAKTGFNSKLARRLLLSCLVDADHTDTARHFGRDSRRGAALLRASERLAALNSYVAELIANSKPGTDSEKFRHQLRHEVYYACRDRTIGSSENILACDGPVGVGKTTAVMAHLLKVASERRLRRVFVIAPFTSIIDQSVEVYRKALRLQDETEAEMEVAVAAQHHRVEYESYDRRHLSTLWDSPVVATTAVQFFETLAANRPAALRKSHQVPGSAIFVDEAHAAMPAALWPQMFRWLRELCDEWGCHVVLASGSLTRFWDLDDFVPADERPTIHDLIPMEVTVRIKSYEENRVNIFTRRDALSLPQLSEFVLSKPGPRLIILNTVQSAAILANYLRRECDLGVNVEHISTALTPRDRAKTIRRIRDRFSSPMQDWCLVATSCVEAGMDFSFCSAFRESWRLVSLLQIAGRANRSGEFPGAEVWDFRHDSSNGLTRHPEAEVPQKVLASFFQRCSEEGRQIRSDDSTAALRMELRHDRGKQALRIEEIQCAEKSDDYPEIAKLCRIITTETKTVLVDPALIARIESCDPKHDPSWQEVTLNSVQIWSSRLDAAKLPVRPIGTDNELWAWIGEYDEFLGYMAGVLHLLKSSEKGFEPL
jgi:CRISPR-associated endonuclease/helicase Cas3